MEAFLITVSSIAYLTVGLLAASLWNHWRWIRRGRKELENRVEYLISYHGGEKHKREAVEAKYEDYVGKGFVLMFLWPIFMIGATLYGISSGILFALVRFFVPSTLRELRK